MWDVKACRGCLNTSSKLEKIGEASKRVYKAVTGLEIRVDDGYPSYFCTECRMQIRKCLAFRRKALRASYVLKEIMVVKKQVTLNDIQKVDRKITNLDSTCSLWRPESSGFYKFKSHELDETENSVETNKPLDNLQVLEHATEMEPSSFDIQVLPPQSNQHVMAIDVKYKNEEHSNIDTVKDHNAEQTSKYTPQTTNYVSIVTDIKPDNYKELDKIEEEKRLEEIRMKQIEQLNENRTDVDDDFRYDDDDFTKNIDLDDVFKDLNDIKDTEESESEDEIPDLELEGLTRKMKKIFHNATPHALASSYIRYMPLQEQIEKFKELHNLGPYYTAPYKCSMCLTTYRTSKDLKKHAKTHQKRVGFRHKCQVCGNRFETEHELTKHSAENHWYEYELSEYKLYSLHTVVQKYRYFLSVQTDIYVFTDMFTVKRDRPQLAMTEIPPGVTGGPICRHCDLVFNKDADCKEHMRIHDSVQKVANCKCGFCDKVFSNLRLLVIHFDQIHNTQFECKKCDKKFYSRQEAIRHKTDAKQKCLLEYECEHCGKVFETKNAVFTHSCKAKLPYNKFCTLCAKSFNKINKLYRHQLDEHRYISINDPKLGAAGGHCSRCDVTFVTEKLYKMHVVMENHPEVESIEFSCTTCKKIYENKDQFDIHLLECNKYPKKCPFCDTICERHHSFRRHLERHHHSEKNRILSLNNTTYTLCEYCGKALSTSYLYTHMKTHISTKPDRGKYYVCKYCKRIQCTPKAYMTHVLTNHVEKPYHCTLCTAKFQKKHMARDHILKSHAPERPYKCDVCDRMFSHETYLRDHRKKMHNITTPLQTEVNKYKIKDKIYVYPHMKIDASLLDKDILKEVEIGIYDYAEKNHKVLENPNDHLILDSTAPPLQESPHLIKKLNQLERKKISVKHIKQTIKRQNDDVQTGGPKIKKRKNKTKAKAGKMKTENVKNESNSEAIEEELIKIALKCDDALNDEKLDSKKVKEEDFVKIKNEDLTEVDLKCNDKMRIDEQIKLIQDDELVADDVMESKDVAMMDDNYSEILPANGDSEEMTEVVNESEVFVHNGENYVMISGVLYKVETE